MRIIYLTNWIGTKKGGGSSLSGKRFLDLLISRYSHVCVVSDSVREPPQSGDGYSVSLIRRSLPSLHPSPLSIVKYLAIRFINLMRPQYANIEADGQDVLIVCNSFVDFLDKIKVNKARSVHSTCVVRGDVNSFQYQEFGPSEDDHDKISSPLAFLRRFDSLIFVSIQTRDNWLKLLTSNIEAYYLPNSINENELECVRSIPIYEVRKKIGFLENRFHVVVVGSLQNRKGQDVFIKAGPLLRQEIPNIAVHFVGVVSKWGGLALERSLKNDEDIFFVYGHREDAMKFIRAADAAVMVSLSEAFPRTVAEYMAMGAAIVSTPVAGADEMIIDERTGLIIPFDDPVALVNALRRLASNQSLRNQLGQAARDHYYNQYSADQQKRRFDLIFANIDANYFSNHKN